MTPEHRNAIRNLFRLTFQNESSNRLGLFIDIENWIIERMENAYAENDALVKRIEELESKRQMVIK